MKVTDYPTPAGLSQEKGSISSCQWKNHNWLHAWGSKVVPQHGFRLTPILRQPIPSGSKMALWQGPAIPSGLWERGGSSNTLKDSPPDSLDHMTTRESVSVVQGHVPPSWSQE